MKIDKNKIFEILNSLKTTLTRIVISILILSVASFYLSDGILEKLHGILKHDMVALSLTETFFSTLKISLYGGFFLSVPYILFELWRGIGKHINENYDKYTLQIVAGGTALFLAGALLCYYMALPAATKFLVSLASEEIQPLISIDRYLGFCAALIFAFAFMFEMPLIFLILNRMGILKTSFLIKQRRYAILAFSIVAAVVTPTPDAYTMLLMLIPLVLLYEVSIIILKFFGKKEENG